MAIKPVKQEKEKWSIYRTNNVFFRISKDLCLTFEGTERECKEWITANFTPIKFKVNELFKTITFLADGEL